MDWHATWDDPFSTYLTHFDSLIGDARTCTTFTETIKGIIAAGSLVCQRIAAHSPVLGTVHHGAQRVLRMVTGESTTRSHLDATSLTAKLREHAVEHLATSPGTELWLIADGSEFARPTHRPCPT